MPQKKHFRWAPKLQWGNRLTCAWSGKCDGQFRYVLRRGSVAFGLCRLTKWSFWTRRRNLWGSGRRRRTVSASLVILVLGSCKRNLFNLSTITKVLKKSFNSSEIKPNTWSVCTWRYSWGGLFMKIATLRRIPLAIGLRDSAWAPAVRCALLCPTCFFFSIRSCRFSCHWKRLQLNPSIYGPDKLRDQITSAIRSHIDLL